jgi:hypothetical protein
LTIACLESRFSKKENLEVVNILLRKGADTKIKKRFDKTALDFGE